MKTDHPILVLMRGIPGSGKSYLADALQKQIGADKVVLLDPDSTDYKSDEYLAHTKKLSEEGVEEKFHPYRFVRNKAWAAIEAHKILVWNQPFTDLDGFRKTIINLQNYAKDHDTTLPLLVVEVEADADVAKQRVENRKAAGGHGPSDATFARRVSDYRSFADEEGLDHVVTVHGEDDVVKSAGVIAQAIAALEQ